MKVTPVETIVKTVDLSMSEEEAKKLVLVIRCAVVNITSYGEFESDELDEVDLPLYRLAQGIELALLPIVKAIEKADRL